MLPYHAEIDWQKLPWKGESNSYVFWLEENIGDYITDWDYDDRKFYFKNPEDAIMFTLRWS